MAELPATVRELVHRSVSLGADAIAVLDVQGTTTTYEQFERRIERIVTMVRAAGVGPGDVVLVALPNGPEMLVATIATMCSAVCAPMNPAYTREELETIAEDVKPGAVVTGPEGGAAADLAAAWRLAHVVVDAAATEHGAPTGVGVVGPEPGDIALLLHTAGTTARPKQVPLTHANLTAAARNVTRSLALTPQDRCLNVMPLFHSHGLLGAALSTLDAGASIVCAPGMDPRRFLGWASDLACTWYTAAATLHRVVLDAPGDWPGLRFMRSASAPLAPQVAAALEARFGAPMIEVYGMTEAYQIAANPLPPGERRLGTVGLPTGTEVAVLGPSGIASVDAEGEIVVRGPAVFGGYASPAAANAEAFVEGWFRTGDLGRIGPDGYLAVTGRVKEQINRGGEKVSPREVEEAVLDHPDVAEAMAFPIPDELLGEEIGVAIVPADGIAVDAAAIRAFLRGRLAPFKIPRRVVLVDAIPKSSTGKPQRRQFAEEHGADLAASRDRAAVGRTGTAVVDRLAAIWQELLELAAPPRPDDHFFDLGGTSLLVMELVARIEADLGVDLPVLDVVEVPTLGDLAARIEHLEHTGSSAPLLRRYRAGGSGVSLVLVPGQYGMAVGLNLVADAVDADVDIFLFDYPGHRRDERPAGSIDELAAVLVSELDAAGRVGPIGLYGNSLGAWVAFEAARRLDAAGRGAIVVGIGDMYSPYLASRSSPNRPPFHVRLRNRARRVTRDATRRFRSARAPAARHAVQRRREAVLAASERARRSYEPRSYRGDVVVVVASEREPRFGPTLGWEHQVTGEVRSVRVDASHSDMHVTQAAAIGAALSTELRRILP